MLGSHNSFHIQARPALFSLLAAFDAALAASLETPGGMPGRCNPVNAPEGCRVEGLERLK